MKTRYLIGCFGLFLSLSVFAASPREAAMEEAVLALNQQMDQNALLIEQGKLSETKYIVDLRSKWWKGTNETVSQADIDAENVKLRGFNQTYKVAYYTILSAPFIENVVRHYDAKAQTTYVIFKGQYYQYTDEQLVKGEVNTLINQINAESERMSKEYTKSVALRSKIGNKTNNGILFNVDAVVGQYWAGNTSGQANVQKASKATIEQRNRELKEKKSIRYIASLAMGKRLSGSSVENGVRTLRVGINPRTYNFNANFKPALSHYISTIGNNIKNLGDLNQFKEAEKGTQLEAGIFIYPKNSSELKGQLFNHTKTATSDKIYTAKRVDDKLIIHDYAGLIGYDPAFTNQIESHFTAKAQSLTDLVSNIPYEIEIYITSDQSLAFNKTGIQLAAEKKLKANTSTNKLLIGMHLQSTMSDPTDGTIRFQTLSYFSDPLKEALQSNGYALGYHWWQNLETKKIYYSKLNPVKTTPWGLKIYDDQSWERLGKNYISNGGTLTYNDFSSNFWLAKTQDWAKYSDEYSEGNDELGVYVAEVVFTVGTLGMGEGAVILTLATKEALKYGSKKIVQGAAIDYFIQANLIWLFSEKEMTYAEAYVSEDINGLQIAASGLENIVESPIIVDLANGCLSNAAIEVNKEKGQFTINGLQECGKGAGTVLLVNLLTKGATAASASKYGRLIRKKANWNIELIKARLKKRLNLSDKQADDAIEQLEIGKKEDVKVADNAISNLLNKVDNVIDDVGNALLQVADVTDEIVKGSNSLSDAAKKFWANHEVNCTKYLRETFGNANVGRQITVDVTLSNGQVVTCRLDNLVKQGNTYKIIDAKSSIINNLGSKNVDDLISQYATTNQKIFYYALKNGQVQSIKPRGQRAVDFFDVPTQADLFNINIGNSVEFLVNDVAIDGYNIYKKTFTF